MRYSADSDDDYGVTRRGKKRGKFHEDEPTYAKRDRHLPRLAAEDANDATDGLPEGDRWSTWDQSEILIPNMRTCRSGHGSLRGRNTPWHAARTKG